MKNIAALCLLFFVGSARACSDDDLARLGTCAKNYQDSTVAKNLGKFDVMATELERSSQAVDILCEPNNGLKTVMTCMSETVSKCMDRMTDNLNSRQAGAGDQFKKGMSSINFDGFADFMDVMCDNRVVFSDENTVNCVKQAKDNVTECTRKTVNAAENQFCGLVRSVEHCSKPYEECGEKMKAITTAMYKIFNPEAVCHGCVTSAVSIGLLLFSIVISSVIR